MYDEIVRGLFEVSGKHLVCCRVISKSFIVAEERRTVGIGTKVWHDISDADVDDAEEALILLFEFLLVKDLNCENSAFIGSTVIM